ncbi:MAG: peptide deformylase [Magnetococcus sp. WYHC-3]
MAILPILTAPDKRLKEISQPVVRVDAGIRQLMDDMLETMYHAPGIGLAAPQVGVLQRVIVVDLSRDPEVSWQGPLCLANPEIIRAQGEICWEEGCLSVPESLGEVTRFNQILVRGLGRDGQVVDVEAEGLFAVCLQHEIDHLDGILFIDRLSRLKRELVLKKLKKLKERA